MDVILRFFSSLGGVLSEIIKRSLKKSCLHRKSPNNAGYHGSFFVFGYWSDSIPELFFLTAFNRDNLLSFLLRPPLKVHYIRIFGFNWLEQKSPSELLFNNL